jgi:hypothetical protein
MSKTTKGMPAPFYLLTALSLWIGWGIRGNFGHEYGAMIPGALASMAVVLLSGRADWHERIAYFAMFGALGWSFGGSISYMQVVAYTHSGDSLSVLYGFVCLFVIGFLWAALGGAGTALAAVADTTFLAGMFLPMTVVFALWWLQGVVMEPQLRMRGYSLDWYDSDWLAALLAVAAALGVWVLRGRLERTVSLILHLAVGWWAGFGLLVLAMGLRMTPPRGDNWAGCVGMTGGLLWWCARTRSAELARAALKCGFIGGIGFAAASMLKLVEVKSGFQTNWHSILEQTTGCFNGIALAVALAALARSIPQAAGQRPPPAWIEAYALGFVLVGITYLNLRKHVTRWVAAQAVPPVMAGIATSAWYDLGYLLVAIMLLSLWVAHRKRELALLPSTWLGKGQLLYAGFLWWMVVGNFERALVAFSAERLVTEGVIFVVALAATLLLLLAPQRSSPPDEGEQARALTPKAGLPAIVACGLAAAAGAVLIDWAVVRAIYGDRFAGHANMHIRFGPRSTINRAEHRSSGPAWRPEGL